MFARLLLNHAKMAVHFWKKFNIERDSLYPGFAFRLLFITEITVPTYKIADETAWYSE